MELGRDSMLEGAGEGERDLGILAVILPPASASNSSS